MYDGTHAARPVANALPAPSAYFETDTGLLYVTDGAAWNLINAGEQPYPTVAVNSFSPGVASSFVYQYPGSSRLYVRLTSGASGYASGATNTSPIDLFHIVWPTAFSDYPLVAASAALGSGSALGDAVAPTSNIQISGGPVDHLTWAVRAGSNNTANAINAWVFSLPPVV